MAQTRKHLRKFELQFKNIQGYLQQFWPRFEKFKIFEVDALQPSSDSNRIYCYLHEVGPFSRNLVRSLEQKFLSFCPHSSSNIFIKVSSFNELNYNECINKT